MRRILSSCYSCHSCHYQDVRCHSKMITMQLPYLRSEGAKAAGAAVFYGICSVSLNFLNKAVMNVYDFNHPFFIMVCQMTLTVAVLDVVRVLKWLPKEILRPYEWREGKSFLAASLTFALHSTLSLTALHGMNIPMYTALKRCAPLASLILSVVVLKQPLPSKYIILSIFIITFGCLVATIGDLEFDQYAYIMGFLSVLAQAGYLTLVQKAAQQQQLEQKQQQQQQDQQGQNGNQTSTASAAASSTIQMLYVNGYNTLPVFVVACLIFGEPLQIIKSQHISDGGFYMTFALLISSGCVLTFSQFLCAAVCSALTTSLVGVAKSVVQTSIGFFTFGGVRFSAINIIGILLNTLGACMYSLVKYQESKAKKLIKRTRTSLYMKGDVELGNRICDNNNDETEEEEQQEQVPLVRTM